MTRWERFFNQFFGATMTLVVTLAALFYRPDTPSLSPWVEYVLVGFVIVVLSCWFYFVRKSDFNSFIVVAYNVAAVCLTLIVVFAIAYHGTGLIDTSNNTPTEDRGTCLYFSIVTWTTLGYGDFRPSPAARPLAAAEAIIGYVAMVISIGLVAKFLPSRGFD